MKIDSKLIKIILMSKFRFKNQLMVTSECSVIGGGLADILTYDYKKDIFVEIEIKISKQDLKKDIEKSKHYFYTTLPEKAAIQQFYYAVPSFLVEYCREYLHINNLPYGIIEIIEDNLLAYEMKAFDDTDSLMRVIKKCPRFNKNKSKDNQRICFMNRISSELVTRERELLLLRDSIFNKVDEKK